MSIDMAPGRSLVGPCPLTWHRGRSLVGPCPLTWHRGRSLVGPCPLKWNRGRSLAVNAKVLVEAGALAKRNVAVIHRPPGALPPFQTFVLTARRGLWRPYPGRRSLWSLARGLWTNPPSSGLGWPSAIRTFALRTMRLLPRREGTT